MAVAGLKWKNRRPATRRRRKSSSRLNKEKISEINPSSSAPHDPSFSRRKQEVPCGLKNLTNSCYLNSILQVLVFTPLFADFCLSGGHSRICDLVATECFFCILESTVRSMMTTEESHSIPTDLYSMLTAVSRSSSFKRNFQEDAHECLIHILNRCEETCPEYNGILKSSPIVRGIPSASSVEEGMYHGLVIKNVFGGQLCSTLKCSNCKAESETFEDTLDISLDVSEGKSVYLALNRFTRTERVDGLSDCSCCKTKSPLEKSLSIQKAPRVLIMQLKRFSAGRRKIRDFVSFRNEISLGHCMSKTSTEKNPSYELYGVVCHNGRTQSCGHYVSYVKDSHGKWYLCDDHNVRPVAWKDVQSAEAYLLLYRRKDSSSVSEAKRKRTRDFQGANSSTRGTSWKKRKAQESTAPLVSHSYNTRSSVGVKRSAPPESSDSSVENPEMWGGRRLKPCQEGSVKVPITPTAADKEAEKGKSREPQEKALVRRKRRRHG